jgi:hypothetical protein
MSEISDLLWSRSHHRDRFAAVAARSANELASGQEHLEKRIEMLTLVSRALWELIEKKTGLEERDLIAKVAEIDLRDGQLDHRLRSPIFACPNCGGKVNTRTRMCVYCGFRDFPVDVFEEI